MFIGDLMGRLSDETSAAEAIMASGDLALLSRLQERARAEGESLGACTAAILQRYAAQADDEEWLTLIGLMNRADDPSATCLRRAVAWIERTALVPIKA
jgi:hypothetical protein